MVKSRIFLPLMILLLVFFGTAGEARELFVNATEAVTISPSVKSQEIHLLMKFSMPQTLADRRSADFACIVFDVGCSGDKDAVSFEAFSITAAWNEATVSWTEPWANAGGDWDGSMSADWVVPTGVGKTVYLDITDFVNGWLKEPSTNFGILVRVSEPFTGTFSWTEAQTPKLRILY